MIHYLNNTLRTLLKSQVASLQPAANAQFGFVPPDTDWRGYVHTLAQKALNVYLIDVRENRKLRSNERLQTEQNGLWTEEPAPDRVDCHYLISAWSPAHPFNDQAQQDEHKLLSEVLATLLEYTPLKPSSVPGLSQADAGKLYGLDLPTQVVPSEGFPKLAEFWGTMGSGNRWKPSVYLIVTLPVFRPIREFGSMVTTCITRYPMSKDVSKAEVWIQIGGLVLDETAATPTPVSSVPVSLLDDAGRQLYSTESDELGRFTFEGLLAGNYTLQAQAPGFALFTRSVQVPSPTGDYDLHLT